MKIIISPSKTKDFNNLKPFNKNLFQEKTNYLKNIILNMNKNDLEKILKYNKIDDLDYKENNKNSAIYSYDGLVFKNLNVEKLKNLDKLYILSAYYGILRANDGISNYRLDMNNNIVKKDYKNMYDFWNNLYNFFEDEDYILNFASKEYSKMLNPKNIINFEFYTKKNEEYKILSTSSKIMRGKFTSYILNNNIFSLEDIKKIEIDGYKYNKELSDKKTFKFYNNI